MTSEERDRARCLYWDMAITRKRIDTAVRERRFGDANDLGKHLEVIEIEARKFLKGVPMDRMKKYITDMGTAFQVIGPGGMPGELPRYGVWAPVNGRYQVIATDNDLKRLQSEHNVPDERVIRI